MIKRNSAMQLAKLLHLYEDFEIKPENINKYGTEAEFFILKKIKKKGKSYYVPDNFHKHEEEIEELKNKGMMIDPEFASFMLETMPAKPFESYLNCKEIHAHFKWTQNILDE